MDKVNERELLKGKRIAKGHFSGPLAIRFPKSDAPLPPLPYPAEGRVVDEPPHGQVDEQRPVVVDQKDGLVLQVGGDEVAWRKKKNNNTRRGGSVLLGGGCNKAIKKMGWCCRLNVMKLPGGEK